MSTAKAEYLGNKSVASFNAAQTTAKDRDFTPATDDYIVNLINMTNLVFLQGSTNFDPQTGQGDWFTIPRTPQNCRSNCDDCHDNGSFQPIFSVNCNSSSFTIWISTLPEANGSRKGAGFPVSPHCDVNGGTICIIP
ncbi:hypothetical protein [Rhizobium leguminosarum]|uniref:hypothetical protein n=1 Tax=Rhizobium leguminosarum TaxID=384 RepID=UPI00103C54AC|nr:hypothetical protein [Rhizobium leguminosarum]TBZ07773.1 hypothetical protein E0H38_29545 [Rhizobium leguminosarum bv. viciae]